MDLTSNIIFKSIPLSGGTQWRMISSHWEKVHFTGRVTRNDFVVKEPFRSQVKPRRREQHYDSGHPGCIEYLI